MENREMAPKQTFVQFHDSKSIPVSLRSHDIRSIVGRSNSAITPNKKQASSTKLRRHAKSEPISSPKDSGSGLKNPPQMSTYQMRDIHRKVETPKRPTFLPIQLVQQTPSPSRIPSATESRDLPGERIKTTGGGIGTENRLLRLRIQKLEEKQSKLDILQASLDRLQHDYLKLNELCLRKSQIDEKRMSALEFALRQVTIENERLRNEGNGRIETRPVQPTQTQQHQRNYQQPTQQHPQNYANLGNTVQQNSSPNNATTPTIDDFDRRESPTMDREQCNSWKSNSSSSSRQNGADSVQQPTQGEFRAAFNSFNFLLNAIRERDSELNLLKVHMFKVEQQQKQQAKQQAYCSQSPIFHYPPDYPNGHDVLYNDSLYQPTNNHIISGVLTPPSDFAPPPLSSASLEDCHLGSDGYQSQTSPETPQQH